MVKTRKRRIPTALFVGGAVLALTACGSSDPLAEPTDEGNTASSGTIVVGSQAYYSNEIIAEIYAQALEGAGHEVERKFNIGERDAYLPSLESGEIDLFPEYTGNLLQSFDQDTTARETEEVYQALGEALPESLTALEMSPATDQDSYTVTAQFAEDHALTTIGDLAGVDAPLTLGGPPELEARPYGPQGVKETYGVDLAFEATGDTTIDELLAGTVNVANVFTASPRIQTDDLVPLEDPKDLLLASNVVPIASSDSAEELASVIDPISEALTTEGLIALNVLSDVEKMAPEDIAKQWLSEHDLQ